MAITENPIRSRPAVPSLSAAKLVRPLIRVGEILATWTRRRRCRADLARLLGVGPYLIDDIGLTLAEARREIEKPIWRG